MYTHTHIWAQSIVVVMTVVGVIALSGAFVATAFAVEAPTSVVFDLEKKFSGPVPTGYTADQFTFTVTGTGFSETVALTAFNNDSANGTIELTEGTYTITENGPAGFVPAQWTVKWDGAGCTGVTGDSTTIEIGTNDYGKTNFGCRADNQWRHGTARVEKVIVGTSTPFESFSFVATDDNGVVYDGAFDVSGYNEITLAAGNYSIVEDAAPGFLTTYSDGCSGTVDNSDTVSCVITNTYTGTPVDVPGCTDAAAQNYDSTATVDDGSCTYLPGDILGCTDAAATNYDSTATIDDGSCVYSPNDVLGCTDVAANNYNSLATIDDGSCDYGGGGGNPEDPTYLVFGYVWHDENENEEWDGFADEDQSDKEDDLDGWEVTITNGSTTYTTTTDESGYYQFYVPVGTWTISETLQSEWTQTFPNEITHTVVVVDESEEDSEPSDENELLTFLKGLITPAVALAQTPTTYGPFNFGNFYTGGGQGGNPNPGGGSTSPRCEFDYTVSGSDIVLTWDTRFATAVIITQNGTEIVNTTTDLDGTMTVGIIETTEFVLTASRGSRDRTCTIEVPYGTGSGGGNASPAPEGQILGEQVSVVPVGAPATGGGGAPQPIPAPSTSVLTAALLRRNEV